MLMQKGFGIGTYEIPVSFQKKQIELLIYTGFIENLGCLDGLTLWIHK
jgi:hypothetical protein